LPQVADADADDAEFLINKFVLLLPLPADDRKTSRNLSHEIIPFYNAGSNHAAAADNDYCRKVVVGPSHLKKRRVT
jgi:hypothetical protein